MEDLLTQLLNAGLLDSEGVGTVRAAMENGKTLDDALREVKGASEEKILRFLGEYFAVPFVDLEKDAAQYAPPKELLAKFPARILLDRRLMPLAMNGQGNGQGNGHGNGKESSNGNGDLDGDGIAIVTSRVFDHTG